MRSPPETDDCVCLACEIRRRETGERRSAEADDYVAREPLTGEESQ